MPRAREIEEALRNAGMDGIPPGVSERLEAYLALLLRWNARMNLTSVRDPEKIVTRHLAESIFAAEHLPQEVTTLLDFGSGAGLPGIPIALCRPETRVTLAESQSKKAAFLREAVRTLELESEVYAGRVESMPESRVFDAVTLRGVDKMKDAVLAGQTRAGKVMVLFLSEAQIAGFSTRAAEFEWREPLRLPSAERRILLIGERKSVPRGT